MIIMDQNPGMGHLIEAVGAQPLKIIRNGLQIWIQLMEFDTETVFVSPRTQTSSRALGGLVKGSNIIFYKGTY
jgi:hypothetical protein